MSGKRSDRIAGRLPGGAAIAATAAVPEAAGAAIRVMQQGGNAFDGALVACFIESVCLPMKCGLGGDLVAVVRRPDNRMMALVSVGPGGARFAPGQLTETGPRSIGVPGAPDGYASLASLGRVPLDRLVEPAADMARRGVVWSDIAVALTAEAEQRLRQFNRQVPFLPDGRLPIVGKSIRLPGIARLLERFAELRSELFWDDIGRELIEGIGALGGLLTIDDLRVRPAEWTAMEPYAIDGQRSFLTTPYPTHGPRLRRALELTFREGMRDIEAIDRAIAEDRADGIDGDGTSVVSAADDEGNAVVVVHSNSFPQYGSGVVLGGYDLVLNNRPGRGFNVNGPPESANSPCPGRVPRTTLHAWALADPSGMYLGATPGGLNQVVWNLQTVISLLDGKNELADIVSMPRWGLDARGAPVAEQGHAHIVSGACAAVMPRSLRSATQILHLRADGSRIAFADGRVGAVARSAPRTEGLQRS